METRTPCPAASVESSRFSRCLNRVGRRPLSPRLERDEEEAVVGRLHLAEQVESDHARVALHSGRVLHDLFDLARRGVGALQRRGVGQLQRDERVALILLRQKRRGHSTRDEERAYRDEREEQQRECRSPDQQAGDPDVSVRRCREDPVEAAEEHGRSVRALSRAGAAACAASAGLSVSALNAERTTDTAMVNANC